MSVFITHVEENRDTAEAISRGLQTAGFDTWFYESSSVPGPTYLLQVQDAIENADAVILVISPEALGSHQVAKEVEAAHELDRPIIPVLQGITHDKYLRRRLEWRLALGAFTSMMPARAPGTTQFGWTWATVLRRVCRERVPGPGVDHGHALTDGRLVSGVADRERASRNEPLPAIPRCP